MSSGTPPESLRSVDLKRPKRPLLRVLRFAPLTALIVVVALLTVLGVSAKLDARRVAAEQKAAMLASGSQGEALPASCLSPGFEPGPADIWSGPRAAGSDEAFARHPEAAGMRVEGQDGFNFWGDEQSANFSQALGRGPWLDDQLAQWLAYFRGLDSELSAQGKELLIVVAPAKWELYPEKLPEWAIELRGKTHLDQFLEHSGDLPVADVRDGMAEAKAQAPVYSAVNSHWSPYGALAAWDSAVKCAAELYPDSEWAELEVPAVSGVELQEAPNEFAEHGDESNPKDWAVPVLESGGGSVASTVTDENGAKVEGPADGSVDLLSMPAGTISETGVGKALILRDSTGDALSSVWSRSFAETCQIRHNLDYPDQRPDVLAEAEECGADTVVYVFTERYFSQTPPG